MVTFVNSAINNTGASTLTTTVAWPTVQAGDVALLWWTLQSGQTVTDPSGFLLDQSDNSTSGSANSRFYHRVCDGSETGNITLSISGTANKMTANLVVYRGVDQTAPLDTWNVRNESVSGTTHANPSVTTGAVNCVIVTSICERSSTGTSGWTQPSGYNERADTATLASAGGMTITATADDGLASGRASGTVVTPPVWTSGNAFSSAGVVTWTVSLKPVATGKNPQTISQYGSYF
jgi:hypothetical protein